MHAYNLSILYQCLFGKLDRKTLDGLQSSNSSQNVRLYSFVTLFRDPVSISKDCPGNIKSLGPYFFGIMKNNVGVRYTGGESDEKILEYCAGFYDKYKKLFQNGYFKYIIKALELDGIDTEIIDSIIKEHNNKGSNNRWFGLLYLLALQKEENYFSEGLTSKEIYLRIREECDSAKDLNPSENDVDRSILHESYNDVLLIAKEWFERKKKTGRYRGYFSSTGETEITDIQNKLLTEKGDTLSLYDILFNLYTQNDHSVNLCGIGGSGKTHQILNCIYKIFNNSNSTIPFYIPLNAVRNDMSGNSIIAYLSKEVKLGSIEEVKTILKQGGINILLACDGFNEITTDEMRKIIANDICQIRQEFKTRILISSRRDHTALFNSLNYGEDQIFVKAEVMPLTEKQINFFFEKVHCVARYKYVAISTRKLLQTPQGCVMYADLVGTNHEKLAQITSLGELLHDYIRRILPIATDIARIDEYLKKVAYYMVLKGKFHIYQGELKELIGIDGVLWLTENNRVETVFSKEDDGFVFCHQNFRDYYCALAFSEKIKEIDAKNISQRFIELFIVNNITTNDEILELASAFISDGERSVQSKIDILRENKDRLEEPFHDNYDFPLKVLIRIYAFSHDFNIANLNLSDLNLKEVNLSGYKLYNSSHESVVLTNANISLNTFLKPGLMTASSTICKYQLNNKLYIAAFATTTAIIIDVYENQYEIVRNLPNWGWVNVAYPKLYNGKLAIFLGHRNGNIGVFYPDMIKTAPKQLFIKTRDGKLVSKGNGEIESIEIVNWNSKEYIVFCNSTGDIFYRELYPVDSDECTKISLCNAKFPLERIKDKFKEKKWDITCHLTYRRDNNTIVIAFGNMLFCLDGNSESIKLSPLKIKWNGMNPQLILDVCASSNYLFINEGIAISVLKLMPNGIEKIHELIVDCDGSLDEFIEGRIKALSNSGKYAQDKLDRIKEHEKSCSQPIEVKVRQFRFKYFSLAPSDYYPNEDVVLIGLEANKGYEDAYEILPNFYEIHVSSAGKVSIKPQNNEQKLASHSGVYYKQDSTIFVATTSDDRSVDLFPTSNEEMVNTHIEGAYYGVRDLSFVDSNNILCALYDGSVILISRSKTNVTDNEVVEDLELDDDFDYESYEDVGSESDECLQTNDSVAEWKIAGVIKAHDEWVWKALPLMWEDSEHRYVVSCSYDKTIKKVDFNNESHRPKVLIHGSERILDFYVSGEHHPDPIYWGLSEHYIYNTSNKDGKRGYPAENGVVYRCFTESEQADKNDNVPIVFYTDSKGCHIGKFTNNPQMINLIDYTDEDNIFIRKMKYKVINGVKYLIAVGVKDGQSYIAVYIHKSGDSGDNYELVTDLVINEEKTTGANSFVVFEHEGVIYFLLANKNNTVSLCTFSDNRLVFKCSIPVDAQPLCIDASEDMVFVGLLDGSIVSLSIDCSRQMLNKDPISTIKTHANLYSTPDVNLRNCRFDDEITKKAFVSNLSSYFTI